MLFRCNYQVMFAIAASTEVDKDSVPDIRFLQLTRRAGGLG